MFTIYQLVKDFFHKQRKIPKLKVETPHIQVPRETQKRIMLRQCLRQFRLGPHWVTDELGCFSSPVPAIAKAIKSLWKKELKESSCHLITSHCLLLWHVEKKARQSKSFRVCKFWAVPSLSSQALGPTSVTICTLYGKLYITIGVFPIKISHLLAKSR